MAQEGIAAALTIPDDIMGRLKEAQGLVDQMAKAAERMGAGFRDAASGIKSAMGAINGQNVVAKFGFGKVIEELNILSDTAVAANKAQSATTKGAQELNRALKMSEGNNIKGLQKKAEAIEKAMTAPGIKPDKLREAANVLDSLNAKMERLRSTAQSTADGVKGSLSAIGTTGNLSKMQERLAMLQDSLAKMKSLERRGFGGLFPAGSIEATKNEIDALNARIKATNRLMGATAKNANMVRGMLTMAFNPIMIASFLRNLISIRGEFELAQKSLAVIIQDERKARDMFDEIAEIAIKSPFSVLDLNKYTKMLAAYRIEADKLIDKTKMLGDISAGVGVDMNRLILAYGQVKAATFLKGQELRQFSEAGVNMLGGLADRFTEIYKRAVSTGEVLQMVSKRMVKFEDVDAVLQKQTAEGGTFYKMQEKQAETLKGMIVNLKDRIQLMFNETGTQFDSLMKRIVKRIEWVISHSKELIAVIMPILTFRAFSGLAGMLSTSGSVLGNMFKAGKAGVADMTAAMVRFEKITGRTIGVMYGGLRKVGAAISGMGIGNVVGLVLAIASVVEIIIRNVNALKREVNDIMTRAKEGMNESVAKYNELLDAASDTTKKWSERVKALDTLKSKYGNILSIQDVELSNVEKLNEARAQQIELIKEQYATEAREDAMKAALKSISEGEKKRQKAIMNSSDIERFKEGFLYSKMFGEELPGILELTEEEINAARQTVERELIDGTLKDATEAVEKFFSLLVKRSGGTEEQIARISKYLSDNASEYLVKQFEKVSDALDLVPGTAKEIGIDFTLSRDLEKYRKEIESIAEVRKKFVADLGEEGQKKYKSNPKRMEIDIEQAILEEKWRLADMISSEADAGKISDEVAKSLQDMLLRAYQEATDSSKLKSFVDEALADIADEYPNLTRVIGEGQLAFDPEKTLGEYSAKLHKYADEVRDVISTLNENFRLIEEGKEPIINDGEWHELFAEWAKDSYPGLIAAEEEVARLTLELRKAEDGYDGTAEASKRLERAQAALDKANREQAKWFRKATLEVVRRTNEEAEALDATEAKIAKRAKTQRELNAALKDRKKHEEDLIKYGKDLLSLSSRWDEMDESERKYNAEFMKDVAIDLEIDFPKDVKGDFSIKLADLSLWIDKQLKAVLGEKKVRPVTVEFEKLDTARLKKQQQTLEGIAKDAISAVQKQGKYSQEVLDGVWKSLQERVNEFNALKDTNFTLTLPVKLDLPGLTDWLNEFKDYFSLAGFTDLLALLQDQKKNEDNDAKRAKQEREQNIKQLVTDVKAAAKEFDKLDKDGDRLLRKKLENAAEKLKIKLPKDFDEKSINAWFEEVQKSLPNDAVIEMKLAFNKDATADAIKKLSDDVSALWDKYDNAKKLEGWGLNFVGQSSKSIMQEIQAQESRLRMIGTEDAIAKADEIKNRRLQILRTEQEEAAKIMYEAQKKALDKTEQAYQTMFENINKIRENANKGENKFSQAEIDTAVQAQVAKSMKDIANAEWDAYKATEMYAMAFGDLEHRSKEVLEMLRGQLVAFKSREGLDPSDIRAIEKAITKLDAQIASFDGPVEFFASLKESFASAKDMYESMQSGEIKEAEEEMRASQDRLRLVNQEIEDMVHLRTSVGESAVSEEDYQDALKRRTAAQEEAEAAQKRYNELLEKAKASWQTAKGRLDMVSQAFNGIADTVKKSIDLVRQIIEAFGGELGPVAEGAIKGIEEGFSIASNIISLATSALMSFVAVCVIAEAAGLALDAVFTPLLIVVGAVMAIFGIAKAIIAAKTKKIDECKEAVERLKVEYEKLEDAMNKALDLQKARTYHDEMIRNLNEQIDKLEQARAIEASRKSRGGKREKALTELDDQIDEINKSIKEAQDDWLEYMGGFSDSRNEAKSWAKSWLDAFKETGSGVKALGESFEDMWDEIVATQLSDLLMPQIEKVKKMFSDAVSDGRIDEAEAAAILAAKREFAELEQDLKDRAKELGATVGGSTDTTTLQRGIEAVTEQTAQALESILNSTRFYVADNNRLLLQMNDSLSNPENENSIIANIRSQTRYLRTLATIASAVYSPGSSGQGAGGLKVFVMG